MLLCVLDDFDHREYVKRRNRRIVHVVVGKEGLGEIIKIMNENNIPIVLETPIDDIRDDFENIKQAKSLA